VFLNLDSSKLLQMLLKLLRSTACPLIFFARCYGGEENWRFRKFNRLAFGTGLRIWRALRNRGYAQRGIQRLNLQQQNLPPLRLALSWFICFAVFVGMVAVGILTSWFTALVIQLIRG